MRNSQLLCKLSLPLSYTGFNFHCLNKGNRGMCLYGRYDWMLIMGKTHLKNSCESKCDKDKIKKKSKKVH